jgi:hypothetical protein
MRSRLRGFRLSPGVVTSAIAVFFALGGIGYAAATIGTSDIKNGAVTKKKLHKNAVTSKKVKDGSLKKQDLGFTVGAGATGPRGPTGPRGATGAAGGGAGLRWAVVEASSAGATVVRGNATGAGRISSGNYFVSFQPDIRGCAYVATNGHVGAGFGPAGEISVETRSSANATDVEVRHYNSAGNQVDYPSGSHQGFHIIVSC